MEYKFKYKDGRVIEVIAREGIGETTVGQPVEIISEDRNGYWLRGVEPIVRISKDDVVASSQENAIALSGWLQDKRKCDNLPKLWDLAKVLQRP